MRSYGQYCPMAKAAEILSDRWTLLIVRELLCGVQHFNDLERGLPGISRALLAERLRRLDRAGVLERHVGGRGRATNYILTPAGRDLESLMNVLVGWGARWAFGEPDPTELDPVLLMWWMHGRVYRDRLPAQRVVVQFEFGGARTLTAWLVMEPSDVSVCLQYPGFDIDLLVTADIAAFYRVRLGRSSFVEAVRNGSIQLVGPSALVRAFPRWLALSPAASAVREAVANPPAQTEPDVARAESAP